MGTLDNQFVKFGRSVAEVMKHRGKATDQELDANIGFVLLDKEERNGLASFTRGERFVYEPLPRREFDEVFEQVERWGLDQHLKERSFEKLIYTAPGDAPPR